MGLVSGDKADWLAVNEPAPQDPEGESSLVAPPEGFLESRARDLWLHRNFVVEVEDHIGSLEEAALLVREIIWKREKRGYDGHDGRGRQTSQYHGLIGRAFEKSLIVD